jgi:hypothetical protein
MPTPGQGSIVPAALVAVPRAAVGRKRGANEAIDRRRFQEALARSGYMRTLAEGANAALARAVEADALFRAAEIEAAPAESHQRSRAPAPTAAGVEDAIREVIAQYVSGLESQSVPALKRVWPSLGGREERAIQSEFEKARIVETAFKDPRITINGDTTTVTGFRMHSLVTQDGQRLSSVTRTTMTLRRYGNVWTIEHIVNQQ